MYHPLLTAIDSFRRGIRLNVAWNCLFILMAVSEVSGATEVHEQLPWWAKWWWITALAAGNLAIHLMEKMATDRAEREALKVLLALDDARRT